MNKPVESRESKVEGREPENGAKAAILPSALDSRLSTHLDPRQLAWQRFKRNRAAVVSAGFLLLLLAVIIVWPVTLKIAGSQFRLVA